MNLILFGSPGVGKGTQSTLLVENFDMRHISTGDLFRKHIKDETLLGQKAKTLMDKGDLVPDEIVIGMVDDVLKNLNGQSFILDGFPRTVPQAESLGGILKKHGLEVKKVISFQVPEEELIVRLTGRRVCGGCGAVYHIQAKPTKVDGVCDVCGNDVSQRKDDSMDVVKKRLEVYETSTQPVKEFYEELGQLIEVDGTGKTREVFERVQKHIKS